MITVQTASQIKDGAKGGYVGKNILLNMDTGY